MSKEWKDKDGLDADIQSKCRNLQVRKRKGLKIPILRSVEEADKFMDQVGNRPFSSAKDEHN